MTTMQQWTRTMAQKLRTSYSNIASCHAQNVRQLCRTLSLSWLRIISHAASRSISWRIISSRHSTGVTRASFHHTFMIDHALWFFTALTESPTARSSQPGSSMTLTVRFVYMHEPKTSCNHGNLGVYHMMMMSWYNWAYTRRNIPVAGEDHDKAS